ncbi:MAG: AI-2E family transporter [Defluviitaleaceae bacterium]|nr:AI-2E family transporter [Defluviitaleaceae bacterium]
MKKLMDSYQFKSWLSFLLLAAAIIVVFMVASEVRLIWAWLAFFLAAVSPFVWGFVLSYVLNIPRERIEKILGSMLEGSKSATVKPFVLKRKRGLSILLTYLLVLLLIVIVMNIIAPRIYESVLEFIAFLPVLFSAVERIIIDLDQDDAIPFFDISAILDLISWEEVLMVFHPDNITMVFDTILDFTSTVFSAALAIISSIYFLSEGPQLRAFVTRAMKAFSSSTVFDTVAYYGSKVNAYFKRYIFCQVLDALILGIIMTVVTSLLGVRHAFVIGPMLGVANLIPYFGSIVGTVVAIIIILLTDGLTMGMIAALVLLAVQQIDSNIIFPRLLGGSMKISPLLVIIAIAVGNAYYGIVGMIVAIPIIAVMKNIMDDILLALEEHKGIKPPESTPKEEAVN